MLENRAKLIAKLLVDYSTSVKRDEQVIIHGDVAAKDFVLEVYKNVLQKGAHAYLHWNVTGERKIFYKYARKHQLEKFPKPVFQEVKESDAVIYISAPEDFYELKGIDAKKISLRMKTLKPILDWRVEKTKWVIFQYPTKQAAKFADLSYEKFKNMVFNSCLIDWKKFSKKLNKFKRKLDRVDEVVIKGKKTELYFSIKNRKAVVGNGKYNMPDGEVFTSVVEDSVNGCIYFEIPAVKYGNVVKNVYLEFKEGKVVKAKASSNEKLLKKIIATDEGAKRIGEFGIGLNYNITHNTKQILFDEKIGGTIHLALGRGYKETKSKNESAIHWDLIKDLRKDGEIYFDNELVMKNGVCKKDLL